VPTATPTETPTPAPTATPVPTATPTSQPLLAAQPPYSLVDLRHDNECPGEYIMGQVLGAQGQPLAGVRVIGVDQWGNYMESISKSGEIDYGRFDFPLARDPREYYVTVVDDEGAPLSFSVTIQHRMGDLAGVSCHHIVWQQR
jgi:hypothetical protein